MEVEPVVTWQVSHWHCEVREVVCELQVTWHTGYLQVKVIAGVQVTSSEGADLQETEGVLVKVQ